VAGNRISVTEIATPLLSLIDTAAGNVQNLPTYLNALDIFVETGDIRILYDGNTPTSEIGMPLEQGGFYLLRNVNLSKLKLISVSETVICNVVVGESGEDEQSVSGFSARDNTLESLVKTLQELSQRLTPLGSAMNSGAPSLRVTPIASLSTAVTGPITSAQYTAANLTMKLACENLTAILSNINNVTV